MPEMNHPRAQAEALFESGMAGITKGQVAYERYRLHQGGVAFNGRPIPHWADVRADIRAAWEDVAVMLHEWGRIEGCAEADDDDHGESVRLPETAG